MATIQGDENVEGGGAMLRHIKSLFAQFPSLFKPALAAIPESVAKK